MQVDGRCQIPFGRLRFFISLSASTHIHKFTHIPEQKTTSTWFPGPRQMAACKSDTSHLRPECNLTKTVSSIIILIFIMELNCGSDPPADSETTGTGSLGPRALDSPLNYYGLFEHLWKPCRGISSERLHVTSSMESSFDTSAPCMLIDAQESG